MTCPVHRINQFWCTLRTNSALFPLALWQGCTLSAGRPGLNDLMAAPALRHSAFKKMPQPVLAPDLFVVNINSLCTLGLREDSSSLRKGKQWRHNALTTAQHIHLEHIIGRCPPKPTSHYLTFSKVCCRKPGLVLSQWCFRGLSVGYLGNINTECSDLCLPQKQRVPLSTGT